MEVGRTWTGTSELRESESRRSMKYGMKYVY